MRKLILCGAAALGLCTFGATVHGASFSVNVGYADDVRASPFFPNPFVGSPGTVSDNPDTTAGNIDSGAIQIVNTSASVLTFNSMVVSGFGDGSSFNIWAATTIPVGESLILIQTSGQNFDGSDHAGANPAAIPEVALTINGVTTDFFDTAQVLNTEGSDHLAAAGLNESHQWRAIGTFGGQAVPLPSSALGGLALFAGVALMGLRRARATG